MRALAALGLALLPLLVHAGPPYVLRVVPQQMGFTLHGAGGLPETLPQLQLDAGGEIEDQVDFGSPAITADGRTVAWLAYYPNCCTSYPIPRELVVFRDGAVLQRFGSDGAPVWKWRFVKRGAAVELYQNTVHGDFAPRYERRAIANGRLLAAYEGAANAKAPAWVRALDALP